MSSTTERVTTLPANAREIDCLADQLIQSLDIARSIRMPLLERLLEMSLIELGQTVANAQKANATAM